MTYVRLIRLFCPSKLIPMIVVVTVTVTVLVGPTVEVPEGPGRIVGRPLMIVNKLTTVLIKLKATLTTEVKICTSVATI